MALTFGWLDTGSTHEGGIHAKPPSIWGAAANDEQTGERRESTHTQLTVQRQRAPSIDKTTRVAGSEHEPALDNGTVAHQR